MASVGIARRRPFAFALTAAAACAGASASGPGPTPPAAPAPAIASAATPLSSSTGAPTAVALPTTTEPARARGRLLAVYRVDDSVDPLAATKDADIPDGVELRFEMIPAGDRAKSVRVSYAFARVQSGEKPEAAAERLRSWVASVPHPFGTFFAIEPLVSEVDAGPTETLGYRTLLVREPVVVDDRDVAEARVEALEPGRPVVRVTLKPEGSARLEHATREWVARRLAIVVDGLAVAAPLILEAISSGRATVPAPGPTEDARRAWADRLARSLRP